MKGDATERTDVEMGRFLEESLRYLVYTPGSQQEMVTFQEEWIEWQHLEDETQDELEKEWQGQPSLAYPQMSKLQAARKYGVYWKYRKIKISCSA